MLSDKWITYAHFSPSYHKKRKYVSFFYQVSITPHYESRDSRSLYSVFHVINPNRATLSAHLTDLFSSLYTDTKKSTDSEAPRYSFLPDILLITVSQVQMSFTEFCNPSPSFSHLFMFHYIQWRQQQTVNYEFLDSISKCKMCYVFRL